MGISSPCHRNNVVYISVSMSTAAAEPDDPTVVVNSPTTEGFIINTYAVLFISKLNHCPTLVVLNIYQTKKQLLFNPFPDNKF